LTFVLTDDELALLRFTCDLFFVEESPLFFLEANPKDPADYGEAYQSLIDKGIVDPSGFRITDDALNRIAPITECDGRIVYLAQEGVGDGSRLVERDFYLLDEIAVPYQQTEAGHLVGRDLDHDELLDHLARRLLPRRAGGDRLEVTLSPLELVALCRLSQPLPATGAPLELTRQEARQRLGDAPPAPALDGLTPSRLKVLAGVKKPPARLGPVAGLIGDDVWDAALEGLLQRDILVLDDNALVLRSAYTDAVRALGASERHTFVRYDFGEDEWFIRETSFLVVEGSLFFLGAVPGEEGWLRLSELDGDGLKDALKLAVGALRRAEDAPALVPFRPIRFGAAGDRDDNDTEVNLETIGARIAADPRSE
jgi:hypothetical protein